jgi:thiol:disulfide interchange protein
MCLPTNTDQPANSPGSSSRSILGLGALMLLACLGGPALAGAIGAVGASVFLGAGGAIFALGLCVAVPAVAVVVRRRAARQRTLPGL